MTWHPDMPMEYRNQIVTGDAKDLLIELPRKSVDAFITDPPFFLPATHYQSRIKWQRKWSDVSILCHWWDMMCELFRPALKDTGYLMTFCNADSYAAFYPAMYNRWGRLVSLIWDKLNPGLGWNWRHQHELILVACNSGAYRPDDGRLRSDVLRCLATPSKDRKHPVQKPVALLRQLAEAACPRGGVVCDPFCGSGTTLEGAILAGCDVIGFEADVINADIARQCVIDTQRPLFAEQLNLEVK